MQDMGDVTSTANAAGSAGTALTTGMMASIVAAGVVVLSAGQIVESRKNMCLYPLVFWMLVSARPY
jgi:hypothetical protein